MGKTALVIGSSGLVGNYIVQQLFLSQKYSKIILLVRRKGKFNHLKIEEVVFDFDNPNHSLIKADDVYCAIGTTLKKAGSKENQYKIDCAYPFEIAKIAAKNGIKQFALVSSLGANYQSSNFYLRTKGDLEEKLKSLQFKSLIIVRPSIIDGARKENRAGESFALGLMKILSPFFIGKLKKYRPVHALSIAKRLIIESCRDNQGVKIIESDEI